MALHGRKPDDADGRPTCEACGRDTADAGSFMRLYLANGRVEFCSPQCARTYRAVKVGRAGPGRDGWAEWAVRWGP